MLLWRRNGLCMSHLLYKMMIMMMFPVTVLFKIMPIRFLGIKLSSIIYQNLYVQFLGDGQLFLYLFFLPCVLYSEKQNSM